ncbi:transposase [Candidatus Regiella insecticola]|uniref:transposase n=1 Tax=Candidatus Regiella insecticola TaxID=138073 RepID=UPI001596CB16|nr:transposase [Candidatus Regiella insecticola]
MLYKVKEAQRHHIKKQRYKFSNWSKYKVIALDSTCLKRYGRDEWHQEKHQVESKRSWRKMHLAVGDDGIFHAAVMSDKDTPDSTVIEELCQQIVTESTRILGDKAYDENKVYGPFPNEMRMYN